MKTFEYDYPVNAQFQSTKSTKYVYSLFHVYIQMSNENKIINVLDDVS